MNNKRNDSARDDRSGAALVTVMCLTLIVSVIVAFLLQASVVHLRFAKEALAMEQAVCVAQAGLEHAAYKLAHGTTPPHSFHQETGEGISCVVIIDGATPVQGWHSLGGEVEINPNNNPDSEFTMKLASGTTITRADLTQDFPGYVGPATNVVVRPKGAGFQMGLLVDGIPYGIDNSKIYNVYSLTMTVNLFNDHVNSHGKAVGKWRIAMASTAADVDAY